ncbi:TIGR04255 family protein [Nocardioides ferulae]|uniref:TIGR04255 family protein n=1 Tax=Nocardioides ferulae TaxID=2340821 RepID=UPI000F88BBEB|nr:TIGR04255 family protein [Nocardioides ferulae]
MLEVAQNLRNTCSVSNPSHSLFGVRLSDLGAPKSDTLKKAPLELVVCQVRHEAIGAGIDPGLVPTAQARLSPWVTRAEQLPSGQVAFPPGVVFPGVMQPAGWRFLGDSGWIVTLGADSFSVECTRYTTWTNFWALLEAVTTFVYEAYSPQLAQRVGLRFVDRFVRDASAYPQQWQGLLNPAVLGFGAHPVLDSATLVAQTSSELLVEGLRANVRGSVASDSTPNGYSFVLDTDCFDEQVRPFAVDAVLHTVDRLHDLNLRLFQSVVTDTYFSELRG